MIKHTFYLLAIILLTTSHNIIAQDVEIIRDVFGVPHIIGETPKDCSFGLAIAMCQDHPAQLVENILILRGEMSKYYGTNFLAQDFAFKSLDFPEKITNKLQIVPQDVKDYIEGFTDGINCYLAQNLDLMPAGVDSGEFFPVKLEEVAVLNYIRLLSQEWYLFKNKADSLYTGNFAGVQFHSNQFAVSSEITSDGSAYLLVDPHTPFDGVTASYEAHLLSRDGILDWEGNFSRGIPTSIGGHNRYIAFSGTANKPDYADAYVVVQDPSDQAQYLLDGAAVPFDSIRTITIEVVDAADTTLTIYQSQNHGIYVEHIDQSQMLFAKLESENPDIVIQQDYRMITSKNAEEFHDAMALHFLHSGNIVMLQQNNNMQYYYNAIAHYKPGFAELARKTYLDGGNSLYLWADKIPFDSLPFCANPEAGFIQNCNSAPGTVTVNSGINDSLVPIELLAQQGIGNRGKFVFDKLNEPDGPINYDYLHELVLNNRVLTFDSAMLILQQAHAEAIIDGNPDTVIGSQLISYFLDGQGFTHRDSTQPTLFYLWRQLSSAYSFAHPSYFSAQQRAEVYNLLMDARNYLIQVFGTIEKPWGEIHGIERSGEWFPLSGGMTHDIQMEANRLGQSSDVLTLNDTILNVEGGNNFVMLIRFKDGETPKVFTMKPHGESADENSDHFNDLTYLYSSDSLRQTFYDENEIRANAESDTFYPYCSVTSMEENGNYLQSRIIAYPNPTQGIVTFSAADIKYICVFDLSQRKVLEVYNSSILNFSTLSKGVYILKIENDSNETAITRVVRN
jgi:acyl-homoserine lactone acylase PvdQ